MSIFESKPVTGMNEGQHQRDLLQKIIDLDPGGLAVFAGSAFRLKLANPAFRFLFPGATVDLINHPFEEIWQPAEGVLRRELLEQVVTSGTVITIERVEHKAAEGSRRYYSYRLHPIDWEGEAGVLVVIWDTTRMEDAQDRAETSSNETQRVANQFTAVIEALPEVVIVLDEQGKVTQSNSITRSILGFDPKDMTHEQILQRLELLGMDGKQIRLEELPFRKALQGKKVRNQRFVLRNEQGKATDLMISSSPLYLGDSLGGAVSVWSDVSELVQRRTELEALARVASALRNAIVQEEMFSSTLEQVMLLLKVDGACLLMPDSATGDVVVRLGMGVWDAVIGQRLPPGKGVTSEVIDQGKSYINNDIQHDERLMRNVFAGGLRCGACVPLSSHGRHIGAIWIGRNQPISEDDVRLLAAIADISASNIYRAWLFEQTQLRLQRLSALHSIDMAITSSLDLQLTLIVLLDQVVSQLQVDAADIMLFDSALHRLAFAAGRGFVNPVNKREPLALGESPAGQVAMERRVISIPDMERSEIAQQYSGAYWLSPEEGFRAYFAAPLIAKGQVKGVIELYHRQAYYPDDEWLEFLDTLATQAAIAIDSAELFERLQRSNEELSLAYDATIEGWSRALELRDQETHGHAQRVTELTIRLARRMGVREEEIAYYRRGVLLHDIGKMAIPDSILLKDGPLTTEEKEIMRRHPVYAYELLHPIAYLRQALDIPYCHHEWWDGSGYPRGLKGEEIPLSARIFAVVDVWDALRSDRSYRMAWPAHKVIEHIRSLAGTHFDSRVVDAFIKLQKDLSNQAFT